MSKKLELLRRSDSTKSFDITPLSTPCPLPKTTASTSDTLQRLKHKIVRSATHVAAHYHDDDTRSLNQERQKTFKTFFHRIGSTGMLNHKSANSSKQQLEVASQKLYRSSSTSQLNTLSSYIKCDDPTDGVNLIGKSSLSSSTAADRSNAIPVVKSSSCDNIAQVGDQPKRGFPYAFLRSKLSVLPEENGGSVLNQKRLLENSLKLLNESTTMTATMKSNSLRRSMRKSSSSTDSTSSDSSQSTLKTSQGTYSRSSSIRLQIMPADDSTSTIGGNSPRINNDWEPAYQRLSSCISSNESGYDSDGRHAEEQTSGGSPESSTQPIRTPMPMDLSRRLSTSSSICSGGVFDTGTVRRRFRQIKLDKKCVNDSLGLCMQPQYFRLDGDTDVEVRYFVSELEVNGLAYR